MTICSDVKALWAPGDSLSWVSKCGNPEVFLASKKKLLDFAVTFGSSSRGRERDAKLFDLAGAIFSFFWLWGGFEHIKTPHLKRGDKVGSSWEMVETAG